jgi:hypothetical protein
MVIWIPHRAAAGGLWTPANATNSLWQNPSDPASIIATNDFISEVRDLSGNLRHFTSATAGQQPLIVQNATGFNGKSAMSFDGSNDRLQRVPEAWAYDYPITVFQVNRLNAFTNSYNTMFGFYTGNTGATAGWSYFIKSNGKTALYLTRANGTQSSYDGNGAATVTLNETNLFCAQITDTSVTTYFNGVLDGTLVVPSPLNQTLGIFSINIGSDTSFGRYTSWLVGQSIIVPGNLSTNERQIYEGYLAHDVGIQGKLPVGHSFKLAPPTI